MSSKTVTIPNISCGHCVMTVQREVSEIPGVKSVKADEATKQAVIEWDNPATWEQIESTLAEINYPPQQLITL